MSKEYTEKEKEAIKLCPDLPKDVAAAFADELLDVDEETGKSLGELLNAATAPDPNLPPAKPGSIQELFPHLRDPRYV